MTADTTGCPVYSACATCGADGPDLAVIEMTLMGDVGCATVCRDCRWNGMLPLFAVATARAAVVVHARHSRRESAAGAAGNVIAGPWAGSA